MEQRRTWSRFSAAGDGQPARGHILVVDNDRDTLAGVRDALEEEGYRVTCAANASTALARAEETPPDLVLLDLGMPAVDGRDFAQQYQNIVGPRAPIVLLSAREHLTEDVERTAEGLVQKPFRLDELVEVVRRFTAAHAVACAVADRAAAERASAPPAAHRPPDAPLEDVAPAATPRGASGPIPGTFDLKEMKPEERLRRMRRLQVQVTELRRSLGQIQEHVRALLVLQRQRSLAAEEAHQVRRLARESELLRWELLRLFGEFERLRTGGTAQR